MATVIWSAPAVDQLNAIADTIALDKPEAARAVVRHIVALTDRLEQFQLMEREVPEFPHPHYRQVWIRPCWIYGRVGGQQVKILHVRRAEQQFSERELLEDE